MDMAVAAESVEPAAKASTCNPIHRELLMHCVVDPFPYILYCGHSGHNM